MNFYIAILRAFCVQLDFSGKKKKNLYRIILQSSRSQNGHYCNFDITAIEGRLIWRNDLVSSSLIKKRNEKNS